jgi:AcrR family transcriptional regulator
MYATQAFEKLPEAKKQHIVQICIEEFADNGYDRTSTDKIVEKAGISKGILFHYFTNKKNLFLYVVRCASRRLTETVLEGTEVVHDEDFFERIKRLVAEKQRSLADYEKESKLVAEALLNPPRGLEKEMGELMQEYYATYAQTQYDVLYPKHLIPQERLRTGITMDTVIEMTRMIVEKITDKYMMMYKSGMYDVLGDQSQLLDELDRYFDVIRRGVYKDES